MAISQRLNSFVHWLKQGNSPSPEPTSASDSNGPEACVSCGMPLTKGSFREISWSHNERTCSLVNVALRGLGISLNTVIRVNIYDHSGPVRGYYSLGDPYTIHLSLSAYSMFPEYVIFHEVKHMVDCLLKGWSEESTPDPFARALCKKYRFRCPPPHQESAYLPPVPVSYVQQLIRSTG